MENTKVENRFEYSSFLNEFENNSSGVDLHEDDLYDKIKQSRISDDPSLDLGVWQHELKRADWQHVNKLCSEILLNKSKDLQVACWLVESHIEKVPWDGISFGLDFIYKFSEKFWEIFYPKIIDGDYDRRLMIYEWFINTFNKKLMLAPITDPNSITQRAPLTIFEFIQAHNYEYNLKRSGEQIQNDFLTVSKLKTIVQQSNILYIENIKKNCEFIRLTADKFDSFLTNIFKNNSPSFSKINQTISEINDLMNGVISVSENKKMLNSEFIKNSENEKKINFEFEEEKDIEKNNKITQNEDNNGTINNRDDAYAALSDLADFMIEVDKHGVAPHIVKLVASWGNKTFPEIIDDVIYGETMGHKVIKFVTGTLKIGGKDEK